MTYFAVGALIFCYFLMNMSSGESYVPPAQVQQELINQQQEAIELQQIYNQNR